MKNKVPFLLFVLALLGAEGHMNYYTESDAIENINWPEHEAKRESGAEPEPETGNSANVVKRLENDCDSICPKNVSVPNCGSLRMAPNYDNNCSCLLEYKCCPKNCPKKPVKKCKEGTFPVEVLDCCDCKEIRCDACPIYEKPKCEKECEEIEYEKSKEGCKVPVCRTKCPIALTPECPSCFEPESFINGSFCNCQQMRCVKKSCPLVEKPDPKDHPCHIIKESYDSCGCKSYFATKDTYCDPFNKEARDTICNSTTLPDICMKNVIRKKADECGCDLSECVEKKEKEPEVYPEGNRQCPVNHYMVAGVTQCGDPRDACIKCPKSDAVDESSCPKACNDVILENVPKGCTVQKCRAKPCPKCALYYNKKDSCGCLSCQVDLDIIFQQRTSTKNQEFYRNWADFKNGFTSANGYWLGLEDLHQITKKGKWQLLLKFQYESDKTWGQAVLDDFSIGPESDGYRLKFGKLVKHDGIKGRIHDVHVNNPNGMKFTTPDRDGDKSSSNCASSYKSSWWHNGCYHWNFNVPYGNSGGNPSFPTHSNPVVISTQMIAKLKSE